MKTISIDTDSLGSALKDSPWFLDDNNKLVKIFRLEKVRKHPYYESSKRFEVFVCNVNNSEANKFAFDIYEHQLEELFGPADIIIGGFIVFQSDKEISFVRANSINIINGYNQLTFDSSIGRVLTTKEETQGESTT